MFPILLKIGPITIHTYGFLFATGVLAAILLSIRLAKKKNIDSKTFSDLIFYTLLISLLGAKIFLFITEFKFYTSHPEEIKYLLTSGGTFYGGLILGVIFAIWFIRKHQLNFRIIGDIISPAIALGHFFGRLGCFSAGCCFGRQAGDSGFGIVFTDIYAHNHTGVPLNTSIYPTQLMEAILNFLNFLFLIIFYKRKKFSGQIFTMYIFNYSVIRFIIEYFRGDIDRGYVFGGINQPFTSLSIPQALSIVGVIVSIILYIKFRKKSETKHHS